MRFNKFLWWGLIPFLLSLFSCEKFKGDQSIPSYLQIDTVFLQNNSLIEEGALTHAFTDVWVYVDNQFIGAFELPAMVPVLENGTHQLALYAGVKFNGISGSRAAHPLLKPAIYDNFEFVMDSIILINPGVLFYDNTDFVWMEDFEDASHSLEPTSNSDTTLNYLNRSTTIPFYGLKSGIGYIDVEHPIMEVVTYDEDLPGYTIDAGNLPVLMEMDYNSNNILVVGLFVRKIGANLTQHPVVVLTPTNGKWRKIYVNFSPSLQAYANSDYFNVYFRSDYDPDVDTAVVKIDNLKLIQRGSF